MFEIKRSINGQYYFVLKATNGQVLVTSETYTSVQSAQHAITVIRALAPVARVTDG